jgi:hypothetical protein
LTFCALGISLLFSTFAVLEVLFFHDMPFQK